MDPQNRRAHDRRDVAVPAQLGINGTFVECKVNNVSLGGARIEIRVDVGRDTPVTLKFPGLGALEGHLAWVRDDSVGISFAEDKQVVGELLMSLATYHAG